MAKEVKAMTVEDLVAIAEKYDMYLSISLTPLNEEAENERKEEEVKK